MTNVIIFPKTKKKSNSQKEQVYKFDNCAGCHKDMRPNEINEKLSLPYMNHVEHIILCADCAGISRQHGVNI